MLPAGLVVLEADAFRRVRVQVEALLGAARDQLAEGVAREPLATIACRLHLGLIAVVPDKVNRSRLSIKALGVLVLDAIAIREMYLFLPISDGCGLRLKTLKIAAVEVHSVLLCQWMRENHCIRRLTPASQCR